MAGGDVYEKTGPTTWTKRGNLTGPPGPQGNTGQAEAWHSGLTAPASGLGVAGDWYVETQGSPPPVWVGPTYVTVLPTTPTDGTEVYYAHAQGIWHLRYRAGATAPYKWEFIGGTPLWAYDAANQAVTSATWAGTTPSITAPLAGEYDISINAGGVGNQDGVYLGFGVQIGAAAMNAEANTSCSPRTPGYGVEMPTKTRRQTVAAAGTAVVGKAASLVGGTGGVYNRWVSFVPVRVI